MSDFSRSKCIHVSYNDLNELSWPKGKLLHFMKGMNDQILNDQYMAVATRKWCIPHCGIGMLMCSCMGVSTIYRFVSLLLLGSVTNYVYPHTRQWLGADTTFPELSQLWENCLFQLKSNPSWLRFRLEHEYHLIDRLLDLSQAWEAVPIYLCNECTCLNTLFPIYLNYTNPIPHHINSNWHV